MLKSIAMNNQVFFGLLILITVALGTTAQTLLKLGSSGNLINIYLFGGICAYGFSTIFYILVLNNLFLTIIL